MNMNNQNQLIIAEGVLWAIAGGVSLKIGIAVIWVTVTELLQGRIALTLSALGIA